jgi:hypothetical protein
MRRFEQPTLLDGIAVIQLGSCGVAIVDEADADLVLGSKWTIARRARSLYAMRQYRPGQTSYMHTLITGYDRTDHISGNGLDNRRANLRSATHRENSQNMAAHTDALSRFKGVSWHKCRASWRATIYRAGRHAHLGYFPDEPSAARAYDAAAREIHGEFLAVNFPRLGERSALIR